MIRIIDNTLTGLDGNLPSKENLHSFCNLLTAIGIDAIELSIPVFEKMEYLPEDGNYILQVDYREDIDKYPGFYRYTCHYYENYDKMIQDVQMNDVRELIKLRSLQHSCELRIKGLDDLMCGPYEKTLADIKNVLPNSKIIFCPENTFHCASALAVQWLLNYGSDVTTSFAGFRNNAATEEVIMALRLIIRHKPNRDLKVLPKLTELFEEFTECKISNRKPVIGRNIFKVEAGIHADGIKKNPATYEAYEPGCVGGKSELVIGKHSGIRAVKMKLEELKLPMPSDKELTQILELVKDICTENRASLCDEDFERIVSEVRTHERD